MSKVKRETYENNTIYEQLKQIKNNDRQIRSITIAFRSRKQRRRVRNADLVKTVAAEVRQ